MNEHPDAGELTTALEEELRQISALAPAEIRMRLLVAAHCAALIRQELAAKAQRPQPDIKGVHRLNLVSEILSGQRDGDLESLRANMKDELRARLAVANPGYANDQ